MRLSLRLVSAHLISRWTWSVGMRTLRKAGFKTQYVAMLLTFLRASKTISIAWTATSCWTHHRTWLCSPRSGPSTRATSTKTRSSSWTKTSQSSGSAILFSHIWILLTMRVKFLSSSAQTVEFQSNLVSCPNPCEAQIGKRMAFLCGRCGTSQPSFCWQLGGTSASTGRQPISCTDSWVCFQS